MFITLKADTVRRYGEISAYSTKIVHRKDKTMWKTINNILVNIDNFVWGVPLMVLVLTGGILLTIRLGILQIRKLPLALKWMDEKRGRSRRRNFKLHLPFVQP